jgi:hypothetical protein
LEIIAACGTQRTAALAFYVQHNGGADLRGSERRLQPLQIADLSSR